MKKNKAAAYSMQLLLYFWRATYQCGAGCVYVYTAHSSRHRYSSNGVINAAHAALSGIVVTHCMFMNYRKELAVHIDRNIKYQDKPSTTET